MPKQKRATLPADTFGTPTTSALDRLTTSTHAEPIAEEAPEKEKLVKMSVYVTTRQITKLDDLAYAHRKATGGTTNKMDVIRTLIDRAELETIM
ncbi:MAG: hypothetical protein ACYDER_07765 [Ktedonobacteraceae bacterium]